jgi:hypothetical protein
VKCQDKESWEKRGGLGSSKEKNLPPMDAPSQKQLVVYEIQGLKVKFQANSKTRFIGIPAE